MATPNSAYDLLRRGIEQQRAQQPGVDWNSAGLVPEPNPDGDQAPQGLLGRLRALLAEQSQYQPVAGVDESASARLSDPNFRQLSRTATASQPQAARFHPFLGYAPAPAAPIFATAPPEPRTTPPVLAGLLRGAYGQLADQSRMFPTSYGNPEADAAAMMPETFVPPALADWSRQAAPLGAAIVRGLLSGIGTLPQRAGSYADVSGAMPEVSIRSDKMPPDLILRSLASIATLPKRAIEAAEHDVANFGDHSVEPQLVGPALETALLMMGGVGAVPNALRTVGNAAKTLESRSARLYNPPDKPLRPFEADYPMGVSGEPGSPLLVDNRGTALTAPTIAGRRTVGGRDEALAPEELVPTATSLLGSPPAGVASGSLPRGASGSYREIPGIDGPERRIAYLKSLPPEQVPKVVAHEVGHALDELSGQIPTDGLNVELRQLYNTLNTGQERTTRLTGPQHAGYSEADVPRELMAEAIRAYMINPNYIKTVAPKTAARIRQYVNNNPRINQTIQFNSGVAGVLGTGAVAGVPRNDDR